MTLTLGDLSLSLLPNRFLDTAFPRVRAQFSLSSVAYSTWGTPAVSGSNGPVKHIWTPNVLLEPSQKLILDAIETEYHYRRTNGQAVDILLYDQTAPITERNPRTRAIAPDTTPPAIGSSHVAYFAQFNVLLTSDLKYSKVGELFYSCQFTLEESMVVPA